MCLLNITRVPNLKCLAVQTVLSNLRYALLQLHTPIPSIVLLSGKCYEFHQERDSPLNCRTSHSWLSDNEIPGTTRPPAGMEVYAIQVCRIGLTVQLRQWRYGFS
jgi:hypothetical protein